MANFEDIKQKIMADPMNEEYTKRGIPPLFKASKEAKMVIVGYIWGVRRKKPAFFGMI